MLANGEKKDRRRWIGSTSTSSIVMPFGHDLIVSSQTTIDDDDDDDNM